MNPFISAVHQISPLSPAAQAALHQVIEHQSYSKNTELLAVGNIATRLYFIQKGLGRVFYYKDDLDITDFFALDNQFIGAVSSLFTGQASKKGVQLLEASEVYAMRYSDFLKLGEQFPEIERAGGRLAVFAFLEAQARLESIQFLSARERYEELDKKYPGLLNRAPLKHVASYLGITQVSLSRLRAEH